MRKEREKGDPEKGARLRRARELLFRERGGQVRAANALGVNPRTYGAYERGDRNFSDPDAKRFACKFGVKFPWLAWNEGPMRDVVNSAGVPNPQQTLYEVDPRVMQIEGPAVSEGDDASEGEIPQLFTSARPSGSFTHFPTIQVPRSDGSLVAVPVVATWKVPERVLRRRLLGSLSSVHIFECDDDSMEPMIHAGDFVFIDTSQRAPSTSARIFALNEDDTQILRRVERIRGSNPARLVVKPENPRHQTYECEASELAIIGRYICRLTMD